MNSQASDAGPALDLACGPGRNALYLAERGWRVTAVDGSPVAIDYCLPAPAALLLNLAIDARVVDLEAGGTRRSRLRAYDLVLSRHDLQRSLIPLMKSGAPPRRSADHDCPLGRRQSAARHAHARFPERTPNVLRESWSHLALSRRGHLAKIPAIGTGVAELVASKSRPKQGSVRGVLGARSGGGALDGTGPRGRLPSRLPAGER